MCKGPVVGQNKLAQSINWKKVICLERSEPVAGNRVVEVSRAQVKWDLKVTARLHILF